MKHKLFSLRYWFYDFTKITATIPGLIWLRPKIVYENEEARTLIRGGALLCANHQSFLDPVYLQFAVGYRRQRFVCLKEFFRTPTLKWIFSHFLCIPIDKQNPGLKTIREISGHLKDGWVVSIFPEGKVTDGQIADFHSGIVLMAAMSGAPIIPVYMKARKSQFRRLRVAIGAPLRCTSGTGGMPGMQQIDQITSDLKHREEILKQLC